MMNANRIEESNHVYDDASTSPPHVVSICLDFDHKFNTRQHVIHTMAM